MLTTASGCLRNNTIWYYYRRDNQVSSSEGSDYREVLVEGNRSQNTHTHTHSSHIPETLTALLTRYGT